MDVDESQFGILENGRFQNLVIAADSQPDGTDVLQIGFDVGAAPRSDRTDSIHLANGEESRRLRTGGRIVDGGDRQIRPLTKMFQDGRIGTDKDDGNFHARIRLLNQCHVTE